jgi:putative transposase
MRQKMIDRTHSLPLTRQCQLLEFNRSPVYYQPTGVSDVDLRLMRLIDEIHLKGPFYSRRRILDNLQDLGYPVNRKKVQCLMRQMGIMALSPKATPVCRVRSTRSTRTC